jgi:hypothetical protein
MEEKSEGTMPVTDAKTGEVLCDGHCRGVCDPESCDCAQENECETEIVTSFGDDMETAADNQRRRVDKTWGDHYNSMHEGFSWIQQALEDTAINDKNMKDCMKALWENVKSHDSYSAGVLAAALADSAMQTAERYVLLAVYARKTSDSAGEDKP